MTYKKPSGQHICSAVHELLPLGASQVSCPDKLSRQAAKLPSKLHMTSSHDWDSVGVMHSICYLRQYFANKVTLTLTTWGN